MGENAGYAVVFSCKRAIASDGSEITPEHAQALVFDEEFVEASSALFHDAFPKGVRRFKTVEEAKEFMARWTGHPWYNQRDLDGPFEIVALEPVYEELVRGFRRREQSIPPGGYPHPLTVPGAIVDRVPDTGLWFGDANSGRQAMSQGDLIHVEPRSMEDFRIVKDERVFMLEEPFPQSTNFRVEFDSDLTPVAVRAGDRRIRLVEITRPETLAPVSEEAAVGPRTWTTEPCGPLELLVMSIARQLHDRERPEDDWFGLVGSSVTSFCRRAVTARGLDYQWIRSEISAERLRENVTLR